MFDFGGKNEINTEKSRKLSMNLCETERSYSYFQKETRVYPFICGRIASFESVGTGCCYAYHMIPLSR